MTVYAFQPNGQLQDSSENDLAQADTQSAILSYTSGTLEDGRPYYAYIAVKPSLYAQFHMLSSMRKPMVLGDYGTIIAAGFEAEPPPDVVREMREKYGFDDRYEYKLVEEVRAQQKAFLDAQQEQRFQDAVALLKRSAASSDPG